MTERLPPDPAMELRRRPTFFKLYQIRFPVTAIVSIAHRISGILLALAIPLVAWLLERTLHSRESFAAVAALFELAAVRLGGVILAWALAHHLFAGVRHLLFDLHLGTSLRAARTSAWLVFGLELLVVLAAMGALL